jgi:hypothetical protein
MCWSGDTLLYESFHLPTFLATRRPDSDHVLYYTVPVRVQLSHTCKVVLCHV